MWPTLPAGVSLSTGHHLQVQEVQNSLVKHENLFKQMENFSLFIRLKSRRIVSYFSFVYVGYVIEKRSLVDTESKWIKVVTLDATTHQYCVENLKESEFLFRIFAENCIGLSTPTISDQVSLKTHASKYFIKFSYIYS